MLWKTNKGENMENREFNNYAYLSGIVVKGFKLSHKSFGEAFYTIHIKSERNSGNEDIIPVIVSERMVNINKDIVGKSVTAIGRYTSYREFQEDGKGKMLFHLFAREFQIEAYEVRHENEILLDGFICKQPTLRTTPAGRVISDVILAVNRNYGKSDYIPCIFWGRCADFIATLGVGTRIRIKGRMQSREYQKVLEDKKETRIAYEISASALEVMEMAEVKDE